MWIPGKKLKRLIFFFFQVQLQSYNPTTADHTSPTDRTIQRPIIQPSSYDHEIPVAPPTDYNHQRSVTPPPSYDQIRPVTPPPSYEDRQRYTKIWNILLRLLV